MIHWHLAYMKNDKYISSDLDCTKPYWSQSQVENVLTKHNDSCSCREVSIRTCENLMCVVRGLE